MQPFFIELYNLNPPEAPTPLEKSNLLKLIRDAHQRYSFFVSTRQGLPILFSPPRPRHFAFDWRKDWWEKDYPAFLQEYLKVRRFIEDYLTKNFSEESLNWLRELQAKLHLTFSFAAKGNSIQMSLVGNVNQESLFGLAYWEIIDLLRSGTPIHHCQAPKTQKTPACVNIFLASSTKGKKQLFCSARCANRARRLQHYHKTGK